MEQTVRRGASTQQDVSKAVGELYEAIGQEDAQLTVLFVSPSYDREQLQREILAKFGSKGVIGCTTAGEFGPAGYRDESLSGFSIGGGDFVVESVGVVGLSDFDYPRAQQVVSKMQSRLRDRGLSCDSSNTFAYLLIDGLSVREENVVSALYSAMGEIPLFGGSAGDALGFAQTQVLFGGSFHADAAVFAIIRTERPFTVFKTQHFVHSDKKLVVTEAEPSKRVVMEINGDPAAVAYAQAVDVPIGDLSPKIFAKHPLVLSLGDTNYVRSIQQVNEDQSLSFYCAIDEGIVLTVAKGHDLVENLRGAFEATCEQVGEPELVIGCDCVLRNLEISEEKLKGEVGEIFERYRVVGFSTYGEQFNAMHVNQTFTGVALGKRRETS